jgi:recombination protein RecA
MPGSRASADSLRVAIDKHFGPGTMRYANDPMFAITRIPTGDLALDCLMRGGWARGRYVELFGGYNVGKTAISFGAIREAQRAGQRTSFIDVEGTFDPNFAAQHDVELSSLALTDQNTLEQGNRVIDYLHMQLASREFAVIVLDSIASLLPKSEFEDPMDAASMGTAQAKLMSAALRKLTSANRDTVLIFINQTRQSVGASVFKKQSITSGGLALGFYAGTRLEIVRTENIKRKGKHVNISTSAITTADQVRGHRLLVRVEKDKTGATHQSDETTMVYDYDIGGWDRVEELIYLGRRYGLISRRGNSWQVDEYPEDARLGRAKFKKYLRSELDVADELEERIRAIAISGESEAESIEDDEDEDD